MSTLPASETLSGVKVKDEPPDSSSICPVKKQPADDHVFDINTTGIKREVMDSSSVKIKSEVSEIKKVVCIKSEFAVKKGIETLTEVLKETLVPSTSTSALNANDVTSTSDIPDMSTVKLEKVSDSNLDIMKEIVTSSTKVKTENEESTPSVDVNHQIKQEIVKEEVEGGNDLLALKNSEVWNNVLDLLKESGYADKATEENIQHILGWLMNGMLPTEEQLHSLFSPTASDDTSSTASSHPKNDQSDTKAENHASNFKKESVTEESVEDNNKTSVKPEKDAEKEALSAKRKPSKQRKKYGPMSKKFPAMVDDQSDSSGPPHLSPVKDMTNPKPEVEIPPSLPRYSLRRKAKKKTDVDEEVSPTEMFYSDDSDEWTPLKKRKEDGEAFLYTTRKRGSLHGCDDGALSKKKKRTSSPKESTSESDDDEKQRGKHTRRKRGATSGSQNNVSKMVAIGKPGSQNKIVCDGVSHREQGSDKDSGKPYVISTTSDGGNIQVKKTHFVSAKAETKQVDNIEEMPPSTNVSTKIETTTDVKGDEVITNITKTEIKTITRTEIIKKVSASDKVQNQTAAAAALKSLPSTNPASNSKDNNANKPPFNDVFACTKCILAFSTKPLLKRHMFRLHYDEYMRLKKENHWDGMQA